MYPGAIQLGCKLALHTILPVNLLKFGYSNYLAYCQENDAK